MTRLARRSLLECAVGALVVGLVACSGDIEGGGGPGSPMDAVSDGGSDVRSDQEGDGLGDAAEDDDAEDGAADDHPDADAGDMAEVTDASDIPDSDPDQGVSDVNDVADESWDAVADSIEDVAYDDAEEDALVVMPEMGLKMAFIADQGISDDSRAALRLVLSEGADFLVVLGDFDCNDDPASWGAMLDEELGDLPVFAVVGNHDEPAWPGYQAIIAAREAAVSGAECVGTPGEDHACTYRGVHLVLSSVGVFGGDHTTYLHNALAQSPYAWRFCGWHKNQHDMQLGPKTDEAGWEGYQTCQAFGAAIITGHEHSYERTYTLVDVGNAANGHGAVGTWDEMLLSLGSTFVTVSGAGGRSLRVYGASAHDDDTWWATGYTSDTIIQDGVRIPAENVAPGVAFIEFGLAGDPLVAQGSFKTTDGSFSDSWIIRVDPTDFGEGEVLQTGWHPEICADFCQKCGECYANDPGFAEGDCHDQSATGVFDPADCLAGCAGERTPAFDPTTLPDGWRTLSCTEFDDGM